MTRQSSCGRQGFAHLVSALVLCGAAAILCSPCEAFGAGGVPTPDAFLQPHRASALPPTARGWIDDDGGGDAHGPSAAVLGARHLPDALAYGSTVPPEHDAPTSSERLRRRDGRGPPTCDVQLSKSNDDQDDDDDGLDASRASLTAAAPRPASGSTTRRALHLSAGQLSVRAPPQ